MRAREWASLRVDGELSELERLLLRRHLARCEGCRSFADSLTAVTSLMRAAPVERPSRSLAPERQAVVRPRGRRRRLALAAALVAVGAAAGGVVGAVAGDDGPGSPPGTPAPSIAQLDDTGPQVTPDRPPVRPVEPPGEPV